MGRSPTSRARFWIFVSGASFLVTLAAAALFVLFADRLTSIPREGFTEFNDLAGFWSDGEIQFTVNRPGGAVRFEGTFNEENAKRLEFKLIGRTTGNRAGLGRTIVQRRRKGRLDLSFARDGWI